MIMPEEASSRDTKLLSHWNPGYSFATNVAVIAGISGVDGDEVTRILCSFLIGGKVPKQLFHSTNRANKTKLYNQFFKDIDA